MKKLSDDKAKEINGGFWQKAAEWGAGYVATKAVDHYPDIKEGVKDGYNGNKNKNN